MSKLIIFFLFCFVGMSLLSGVMEGGGGIASTKLDGAIGITSPTGIITVDSTDGFLDNDYIIIENEQIHHTGTTAITFTGCTRGHNNTEASIHDDEAGVYTRDASAINNTLGFNVAAIQDSMGWWAAVTIPWNFLVKTIPNIAMINFSFMQGNLVILGLFWYVSVAGLVISMALYIAGGRRV